MAKKKVLIEDLAGMIGEGFAGVDKRFEQMDKRFDGIENVLIRQHSEEIEYLKKRVHTLEEALSE